MKTVSADTEYYKRLVKKLDEQETAIEKTQKEIAEDRKASEVMSKQLTEYLANLTGRVKLAAWGIAMKTKKE